MYPAAPPRLNRIPQNLHRMQKPVHTNRANTRRTSVDRSTKATLSTYNTWIQISRLQKIYRFHSLKMRLATAALTLGVTRMRQGKSLTLAM